MILAIFVMIQNHRSAYETVYCFKGRKPACLLYTSLTFRDKVELLEPKAMREELRQSILQMKKKYDNTIDVYKRQGMN